MFPNDDILIARGKYSTLSRERRAQIARVAKACETAMGYMHKINTLVQGKEPIEAVQMLPDLHRCIANVEAGSRAIVDLTDEMQALQAEAWE